jgi:hypothetical protein
MRNASRDRAIGNKRRRRKFAVEQLVHHLCRECPDRTSGSRQQSRAQRMLRRSLVRLGGRAQWQRFRFNRSLYAVIALHFGLAVLATALLVVSPLLAATAHGLLALLYVADSQRWAYLLRRVFPFYVSQNLVVTFAPRERVRKRVVVVAHADAAPTGWLFHPRVASLGGGVGYPWFLRFLSKPLLLGVLALAVVAAMEVDMTLAARLWPRFPILYIVCNLYFVVVAILNVQIAWRREVVPGANDNLSGCAALPALAERLLVKPPDDVELVFVVTGCEEAGTGGALALAQQQRELWNADNTDVLVLDSLSNGELCLFQEGELLTRPIPARFMQAVRRVAQHDARFAEVAPFAIPAGATDAWPFLVYGYRALAIGCIDAATGTPRHYHLPADSPENLDFEQLHASIDFAEQMIRQLIALPIAAHNPIRQIANCGARQSRNVDC